MTESKLPEWVWVVVEKKNEEESFYGLEDNQQQKFLPAFRNKDDAERCLEQMTTAPAAKYEIQAIRLEVAGQAATKSGSEIFILDSRGAVLERLKPSFDA